MKIYLAGKMRGIPHFNFPAFFAAEDYLKSKFRGAKVFNPARRDVTKYGKKIAHASGDVSKIKATGFSLREALEADTRWICRHADTIAMLPGWSKSAGARAEIALAKALGHKVLYLSKTKGKYWIKATE